MKFYSYTNENKNYTKAISLMSVRSVERIVGSGKSAVRFDVKVNYTDGTHELFPWLHEKESDEVFDKIVELLNKE